MRSAKFARRASSKARASGVSPTIGVCSASMFRQRRSSLYSDLRGSGRYSSWACDESPPPSPPSVPGKPGGPHGPSTIRTFAAGSLLPHSDAVSTEPVEQAVERFGGLNCRDLGGGRLASHCMSHPIAGASTDRSACAGGRQGGRTARDSTGMGSTAAAAGHRRHTPGSASLRGLGARRCRAEPLEARQSHRRRT